MDYLHEKRLNGSNPSGKTLAEKVAEAQRNERLLYNQDVINSLSGGPGGGLGGGPGGGSLDHENRGGRTDNDDLDAEGYFNKRRRLNVEPVGEATYSTSVNQYRDADAYEGKVRTDRALGALGYGTIGRHLYRRSLENNLFKKRSYLSSKDKMRLVMSNLVGRMNSPLSIKKSQRDVLSLKDRDLKQLFGQDYATTSDRSMNVIADYRSNVAIVEQVLLQYNINAKNLSAREIEKALKTGVLKGFYHHGNTIDISKNTTVKQMLSELEYLRRQKHVVDRAASHKGGIKNTISNVAAEGYYDTDQYQGYQHTKNTIKATKMGVKLAGATTTLGINGALSIGTAAVNNVDRIRIVSNKVRMSSVTDQKLLAKYKSMNAQLKTKVATRSSNVSKVKVGVRTAINRPGEFIDRVTPIGKLKSRINATKRKLFAPITNLKTRISQLKFFKGLNAVHRSVNRIKYVAFVALAIIMLNWIGLMMLSTGVSNLMASFDKSKGETVQDSSAQHIIDYLYSYQSAYSINATYCNTETVVRDGTKAITKGLPASWVTQIKNVDPDIDNQTLNGAAVKYNGQIAGYNMSKYWGPRSDASGTPAGLDSSGNSIVYTAYASMGTNEFWETSGTREDGTTYSHKIRVYRSVPVYMYGNAGLNGYAGSYTGSYGSTADGALKYNLDQKSDAYKAWANALNDDVTINYFYRGSRHSCHITGNKATYYYTLGGEKVYYNTQEFYKALITMGMSFIDNTEVVADPKKYQNKDKKAVLIENEAFVEKYLKQVFDNVMDNATVTLTTKYEQDDTKTVSWTIHDSITGGDINLTAPGYKCIVNLNIYINNTGLPDLMKADATTLYGSAGNQWAHSNGSTGIYKQTDSSKADYHKWETTQNGDEIPTWGKRNSNDCVALKSHKCGIDHNYTVAMTNAMEYFDLSTEDWSTLANGLQFPPDISIASYIDSGTWEKIAGMNGMVGENVDWNNVDWKNYSSGNAQLDQFMQFYFKQGWLQGQTGQSGLCCFSSYMMIAMYFNPGLSSDIYSNLSYYAKSWCRSDGWFYGQQQMMSTFGITRSEQIRFSNQTDMAKDIMSYLSPSSGSNGGPILLNIKGYWATSEGTVLHKTSNQHFMVIYGASEDGVLVADPAGTATGKVIPWDALYQQIHTGAYGSIRYMGCNK